MEEDRKRPQKALDIFTGMIIMHGTDGDKENWNSILDYINNIEADLYAANRSIDDQLSIINDLEADLMSVYMKGIVDSNELWRMRIKQIIKDFKIISDNIREQEFPCVSNDLERNDYAVKMLEELLGDKTNGATENN